MGITHEWNGTVLTITSDSGSSSADLKGEKGDTGIRGPQGIAGKTLDTSGIIEMQYTDSKTKNAAAANLTINDSIPFVYPLEATVKQTRTSYEVGVNKLEYYSSISNELMQNTTVDIPEVAVGEEAIFSFDVIGKVESLNPTLLTPGDYSFEAAGECTIQTTESGRCYIEIKNHTAKVTNISMGIDYKDELTYLDNCALRFDGSTEYVPYEKTPVTYDLTEITVTETNSGQTARVNADGTVDGLDATGAEMVFTLDKYNNVCSLTVTYKRNLTSVIDEIKQAMTIAVDS